MQPVYETGSHNWPARKLEQGHHTISTVLQLLNCADHALSRTQSEARQCIEMALVLLKRECELNDSDRRDCSHPKSTHSCLAPWQFNRVVRFVESNLAKKIQLRDLAAVTNLSASYFSRTFRSTVGETPHGYVVRRRIGCAQKMIALMDKSLSEIALDCGFADQAHLTRQFRRIVGVSPGVWRRLHCGRGFTAIDLASQHEYQTGVSPVPSAVRRFEREQPWSLAIEGAAA